MVVAMVAVGVVQVTVDQIVDVITMRHGLMAASRPMLVGCVVTGAGVRWRAN